MRPPDHSGGGGYWNTARTQPSEIAAADKINGSYVGRVLRLTLLAPDIVEAALNGRSSTERI
jgi:hypothetical protein